MCLITRSETCEIEWTAEECEFSHPEIAAQALAEWLIRAAKVRRWQQIFET